MVLGEYFCGALTLVDVYDFGSYLMLMFCDEKVVFIEKQQFKVINLEDSISDNFKHEIFDKFSQLEIFNEIRNRIVDSNLAASLLVPKELKKRVNGYEVVIDEPEIPSGNYLYDDNYQPAFYLQISKGRDRFQTYD